MSTDLKHHVIIIKKDSFDRVEELFKVIELCEKNEEIYSRHKKFINLVKDKAVKINALVLEEHEGFLSMDDEEWQKDYSTEHSNLPNNIIENLQAIQDLVITIIETVKAVCGL